MLADVCWSSTSGYLAETNAILIFIHDGSFLHYTTSGAHCQFNTFPFLRSAARWGAVCKRLTVVDVLEAAAAAVLHADPELVSPQVGAVVGDDVGVAAVLQDRDNDEDF